MPRKGADAERLDILEEHVHSEQNVYPTLADPVTLTAGAGAWTLGNYAEVVPASTITKMFDIHGLDISAPSANEDYEIYLYAGTTFIGSVSFTRTNNFVNSIHVPMTTPKIAANSQIQAKLADGTGELTCKVKIYYHTY